jgi:hypothetical protein
VVELPLVDPLLERDGSLALVGRGRVRPLEEGRRRAEVDLGFRLARLLESPQPGLRVHEDGGLDGGERDLVRCGRDGTKPIPRRRRWETTEVRSGGCQRRISRSAAVRSAAA